MRVEAGAIIDEFAAEDIGHVTVRYERTRDQVAGWTATFTVVAFSADDLALVHRMTAPTLGELRRTVPLAVAFLCDRAIEAPPVLG